MPPDGKYAPKLRGFPTPNNVPDDGGYVLFKLPSTNEWAGLILGAAQELAYPWNWYQWGDMLPEEAAEAFRLIVDQAPLNVLDATVPAPYWDDAEDSDDEAPADDQPWYGHAEGLDFVEEAGIWVITGFIAYSGNIGAAIAFKTFAPKFALAWKRGGVVAAVEVFIDSVSAGEIEIGSGDGIVEQDFIANPDMETHDIMLVYQGEGGMSRVRSEKKTGRKGRSAARYALQP